MSTTENERLELYELAKHEVGDRFAELMMKSLPPEADELIRKQDLDRAADALRIEMRDLTVGQTRTLMLGMVGSVTALAITELAINLIAR